MFQTPRADDLRCPPPEHAEHLAVVNYKHSSLRDVCLVRKLTQKKKLDLCHIEHTEITQRGSD
jgi:hypothetical protein